MAATVIDRLLFGDNQFFGVNHMSEERARAQSLRFRDTSAIIDVLEAALDEGIRTFMCTTHDRLVDVCNHMRSNPEHYWDYKLFPCMPYAHKYNNAVTDIGMLGALRKFAPQGVAQAALAGGQAVVGRNLETMIRLLVDAEMKMFAGLSTPVIFLQNVVVDFLMGLGFKDAFRVFADHVTESYGAEPGFITMNMPQLVGLLEDVGIENPIVCANINKIGFRMCGGVELYESTLSERRFRPIAMSVMASGAIPPEEAIEYIATLPNIEAIVFGASSRAHISQTKYLVDCLMPS
jgi:hypothetical protein